MKTSGEYMYIDDVGKPVGDLRSEQAMNFSEGFGGVKIHEKWGFVDKAGKLAIEPQFDWVANFSEGLALVGRNQLFWKPTTLSTFPPPPLTSSK